MPPTDPAPAGGSAPRRRSAAPRVAELMRRDFARAAPAESLLEAHRTMRLARLRHLLVVDEPRLVGIVSYRELQDDALSRAERLAPGRLEEELRAVALREAIAPSPWFVHPDTPADEAARRMLRLRLGCLPVCVDDGMVGPRLVGILAESDLLRFAWTRS